MATTAVRWQPLKDVSRQRRGEGSARIAGCDVDVEYVPEGPRGRAWSVVIRRGGWTLERRSGGRGAARVTAERMAARFSAIVRSR